MTITGVVTWKLPRDKRTLARSGRRCVVTSTGMARKNITGTL